MKAWPSRVPTLPAPKPKTLRFSPTAWAKLIYLRDIGDTEVGGFGIAPSDDPTFVEDVRLVRQTCSWAHVKFDDESVADFFDDQVDEGKRPEQFARVWIHTHPGQCPRPSGTDELTFERVFGQADWAVMFVLAREGAAYARLRFNVGPGADVELSTEIDFTRQFEGSDRENWRREFDENVFDEMLRPEPVETSRKQMPDSTLSVPDAWYDPWFEYLDDDLAMEKRDDFIV